MKGMCNSNIQVPEGESILQDHYVNALDNYLLKPMDDQSNSFVYFVQDTVSQWRGRDVISLTILQVPISATNLHESFVATHLGC